MTWAISFALSRWTKFDAACLQRGQVLFHARAAVEQQRQGDRLLASVEERDVLLDAVLEDLEVRPVEVGDVVVGAVRDGDVEGDDVDSRHGTTAVEPDRPAMTQTDTSTTTNVNRFTSGSRLSPGPCTTHRHASARRRHLGALGSNERLRASVHDLVPAKTTHAPAVAARLRAHAG